MQSHRNPGSSSRVIGGRCTGGSRLRIIGFYRRERSYGAFRRTIELPGEVDESKIEAAFKNGVLKITLPKTKEAQARIKHIDVKAA